MQSAWLWKSLSNEHYFKNPFLVSAASTPSIVTPIVEEKLCEESEKIAHLLSLKTGIFHVQYILKDEMPVIIEICRRAPGDLYIKFVELATGVAYPEWIVKACAGLDCSELSQVKPKGFFTRHCIMSPQMGIVKNVFFDKTVKNNIVESFVWWQKSDKILDIMTTKLGIVFLKFSSMDEMLEKTEQMHDLIHVEIE